MNLVESIDIEYIECNPVTSSDAKEILEYDVPEMIKIVEEHKGAGLAAPQVGIKKRFFVAKIQNEWRTFFNPMMVQIDNTKILSKEGCLSYSREKEYVSVKRFKNISLIYEEWNENSKTLEKKKGVFFGLDAIVIQHEVDHLKGKTIFT